MVPLAGLLLTLSATTNAEPARADACAAALQRAGCVAGEQCTACATRHEADLSKAGCTRESVVAFCDPPSAPPATLNGHPLKLDASGKIETWLPNATAHKDFVTRAMDHIASVPPDPATGLPIWFTHGQIPIYNNAHNPAGLFASWAQVASMLHEYTGDASWLPKVCAMLEHLLANGTTPADPTWAYPSVPYASSDPGALRYRGAADWDDFHQGTAYPAAPFSSYDPIGRGDGYGVIQPDKVAEVGTAYLLMWKHDTSKAHFLQAAVNCAETLANTMNYKANATHSPWPFRVYAETGIVRQAYSSHVLPAIELFDKLMELDAPSPVTAAMAAQLKRARDAAWSWVTEYPLKNGNWCAMCEDITVRANAWTTFGNATAGQACGYDNYQSDNNCVTTCNYDSIQSLLFAQYMLRKRLPGWETHVPAIIDFVERRLIFWDQPGPPGPPGAVQFGARTVSEQRADKNRMSCHTTRYAATLQLYADAIRETDASAAAAAEENSKRSWAWATYSMDSSGLVDVTPGVGAAGKRTWFTVTMGVVMDTLVMVGVEPKDRVYTAL
eukprot:COSAG04_NODE_33_length_34808_cov_6.920366_12_plen_556_part_00